MIVLRPYQGEAVQSVYRYVQEHDDNPVVVIPTGGGKTPIMATICNDAVTRWNSRVLVLAHVKELVEQTAGTLARMAPDLSIGIYSAGLKRRDTEHPVVVAGIQSVYGRAAELGRFDLILVDEAHMIPPGGEGMYRTFLAEAQKVNPHIRVVGLTATPFRMTTGMICQSDHFLNAVCYEIGVKELIAQGFLSPLRSKTGVAKADTSGLHIRGGEFMANEIETLMDNTNLVRGACAEIVEQTRDRQSTLIFASGVQHGLHIAEALQRDYGVECGFVCGTTPSAERDRLIARFRRHGGKDLYADQQPLKYLCNVGVLTTGFDAPSVDCVALVRPTNSPGLYYQMVGRGFRLCEGKTDCLVLDFGGNIERHGPVDALRIKNHDSGDGEAPVKKCPQCQALVLAGRSTCPDCGYEFSPRERQSHDEKASTEEILSSEVEMNEHEVIGTVYRIHRKRGTDENHPRTLRVDYYTGLQTFVSEFVCFEHVGYARSKAEAWWRERSDEPPPEDVDEALARANRGALAETKTITVRHVKGEKYDSIVAYRLGPKPEPQLEPGPECMPGDDNLIPF
jgi:DNA repair protein RadD